MGSLLTRGVALRLSSIRPSIPWTSRGRMVPCGPVRYNARLRRCRMHNDFTAIIAPAPEGGYASYCLEIPAVGEGETVEACRQNLWEAILLMLTDRRETERQAAPPGAWAERLQVMA